MARRPRILYEGAIYHVTFRGNARQDIFHDIRDRHRMLQRIGECCEVHQVRIYLYCLMPNHVHLLLETPRANLDRFMGGLLTGYSVYFNLKHQRSGHVMQGRYGAQLVSGDDYILKLSRYIHLNPVKTEYWNLHTFEEKKYFLRQYAWSSYRVYIGMKQADNWLQIQPVFDMIHVNNEAKQHDAYRQFIEAGLIKPDEDFVRLIKSNPLAIGSDDFIEKSKIQYFKQANARVKDEDLAFRKKVQIISPDSILQSVKKLEGFNQERIDHRIFGRLERCLMAKALQKYAGKTQREIATFLGLKTGAGVSALLKKNCNEAQITMWMNELDLIFKG